MVLTRSALACTATGIGWKIQSICPRSGMRRPRPAPASFSPPASAKPVPVLFGCRTPGRSFANLKLTLGGRLESWRSLDGFNINSNPTATSGIPAAPIPVFVPVPKNQPGLNSTDFSPKASLSYDPSKEWNVTANFGESYRYPTVTELYQNITVAGVATFANPNLKPEQDFTGELNVERKWNDGRVRLTLFKERTNNAIISQTTNVTNSTGGQTPTTTIGNVDAIRMQGVELSAEKDNLWITGLLLFGSVTYVDFSDLERPDLRQHDRWYDGDGQTRSQRSGMEVEVRGHLSAERQLGLYGRGAVHRKAIFDPR